MATLKLVKGDTWTRSWVLRDDDQEIIDLTGSTFLLNLRDDADELITEATVANGYLVVTPLEGRIDLAVPSAVTSLYQVNSKNNWSIQMTSPTGEVSTIEQGTLRTLKDFSYG